MRKGYIYKIIYLGKSQPGHETPLPYVGSTFSSLSSRLGQHRSQYKTWKEGKSSMCAVCEYFDIYGVEEFEIVELERYDVEDRQQLRKYEQEWIEKIDCCNKVRAVAMTWKENYAKNGDKIRARVNDYRINNRETVLQRKRKYYQENAEMICKKQKDYVERNREIVLQKKKEYSEQKVHCDVCNVDLRRDSVGKHNKRKTHQDNLVVYRALHD